MTGHLDIQKIWIIEFFFENRLFKWYYISNIKYFNGSLKWKKSLKMYVLGYIFIYVQTKY